MKNYKMTKDTCHMYQNYIQRIVETIYIVKSHYWNYVKEKLVLNILKLQIQQQKRLDHLGQERVLTHFNVLL